jgi:PIN domain nuclease of toxin-antitoxin system
VLLDSHVLLWWITDASVLTDQARALFADPDSELLWSAASTWELGIKAGLGKLRLPEPLDRFVTRQLREQHLIGLPIYHDHAARVAELPPIHRDPFDRMLVAQALVEGIPLLTRDTVLDRYGVACMPA